MRTTRRKQQRRTPRVKRSNAAWPTGQLADRKEDHGPAKRRGWLSDGQRHARFWAWRESNSGCTIDGVNGVSENTQRGGNPRNLWLAATRQPQVEAVLTSMLGGWAGLQRGARRRTTIATRSLRGYRRCRSAKRRYRAGAILALRESLRRRQSPRNGCSWRNWTDGVMCHGRRGISVPSPESLCQRTKGAGRWCSRK